MEGNDFHLVRSLLLPKKQTYKEKPCLVKAVPRPKQLSLAWNYLFL